MVNGNYQKMIKNVYLFLFSITSFFLFSQKSKIIFQSNVKHNYAIGKDYYVEANIDTTKLFFMGVIEITTPNTDEIMVGANQLLKTKTKEINGNAYRLKNTHLHDTSIMMQFDVYYAPDKQIELIKANQLKGKIIVFNNFKDTLKRTIWVNNHKYSFVQNKRIEIATSLNKGLTLKLDTTENVGNNIIDGSNKATSRFYTVKLKDNQTPVIVGAVLGGVVGALIASTIVQKQKHIVENEKISKLNYNTGRILYELCPLDKEIIDP